jgi:plastocyanin
MPDKAGKLLIVTVILLAIGSVLLVACTSVVSASRDGLSQGTSTPGASANKSGGASVHMNDTNFEEDSVTLSKGSSLTLVDDSTSVHIIQNGTWDNGIVQAGAEPGAPRVDQSFVGNDTHQIGPFTTAGTFKLFCTVHTGMNLTVVVK